MEGVAATPEPVVAEGEVHLWHTDVAAAATPERLEGYAEVVSSDELARAQRFVRQRDRELFLVAHALVRATLSRYAPVAPNEWRFSVGSHGRPEIAWPSGSGLRFNLSHTPGRAVCGVTLDRDVGVDIERLGRVARPLGIAERFFAATEVAALQRLPEPRRRQRFFELWTLKESYIKARGLGLAIPLDQFWFADPDRRPISIDLAPSLGDDPAAWRFELVERGPEYALAVAVRQRVPLVVRGHQTTP